jgi:integrase
VAGQARRGRGGPALRLTFREAARIFLDEREGGWKNETHRSQWRSTLETYVFPAIGDVPVTAVKPSSIRELLVPIWTTKQETARRVLQRLTAIFSHALIDHPDVPNPCLGLKAGTTLPRQDRKPVHYPSIPWQEATDFVAALSDDRCEPITRLAFLFLILTATRSGEVRGAVWDEIDLDAGLWVVPVARLKTGRRRTEPHIVPLSRQALAVLQEARALAPHGELVFPSSRGAPLSDMTLTKLCRRLGDRCVPHGWRSTFRTWAREYAEAPDDVCEAALAHQSAPVVKAYKRTDLLDERRQLMQTWADFVLGGATAPLSAAGVVDRPAPTRA